MIRNRFSWMGKGRARPGITPVVSIVLLLMMAVAAAGAVYNWFSEIQTDVQGDIETELRTDLNVRDLQCRTNEVELAIKNSGDRNIPAANVDVYIYNQENHLHTAITGLDWRTHTFTNAGEFDSVTEAVPAGEPLQPDEFYTVNIEFTDANVEMTAGSCIAE